MRPVFYDYPDAFNSDCDRSMTFTLGRDLLIAGPPKPESPEPFDICLPKGGWYDYWTGLRVTAPKLTETPKLEMLPVFVRAGTILPRQPVVQSTAETPSGRLSLDIYPGDDCHGEIYADDGTRVGGPSLRQEVRCSMTAQGLAIQFQPRAGTYRPWWKELAVTVHGWSGGAVAEGTTVQVDPRGDTASFAIPDQPGAMTILLRKT
jgi:alpha-glucosidase